MSLSLPLVSKVTSSNVSSLESLVYVDHLWWNWAEKVNWSGNTFIIWSTEHNAFSFHTYTHTHIHMYVYMYTCVWICMYVCDLQRKALLFRLKNYVYMCLHVWLYTTCMWLPMKARRGQIPWSWACHEPPYSPGNWTQVFWGQSVL